mmetsp:Transcript_41468/g.69870  ORF Transcript_41468/g.69870 Transcript_41468/m.69870 type:complete len:81 (+) Transcript_41468:91-333(+)
MADMRQALISHLHSGGLIVKDAGTVGRQEDKGQKDRLARNGAEITLWATDYIQGFPEGTCSVCVLMVLHGGPGGGLAHWS